MLKKITLVIIAGAVAFLLMGAVANATNTNDPGYWCDDYGVKYEPVDTPFIVPEPPSGVEWTLIVVKAGSGEGENETWNNPVAGETYRHPSGKANSHVILCGATTNTSSTSTTSTSTTSTMATTTTVASPNCTLGVKTPYGSLNLTTTFLYQPNLPAIYYQLIAPDGTVFGPPLPLGTYTSSVPGQWYVCYVEEYVTTTTFTTTTVPETTTSSSTSTTVPPDTSTTSMPSTTTTSPASTSTVPPSTPPTTTPPTELPKTGVSDLFWWGVAGIAALLTGSFLISWRQNDA